MGILGTSTTEESALRAAAASHSSSDHIDSSRYSSNYSSHYETASEFALDDNQSIPQLYGAQLAADYADAESNTTIRNVPTVGHSSESEHKASEHKTSEHKGSPVEPRISANMTENELNRELSQNLEAEISLERSLTKSRTHGEYIDPKDLEWDGPDDKENPFNWPNWKKWFITFTVALVCLCVSLGSSLYVEGVPELEEKFGISQTLGLAGLTFYLVGLALGPVIAAPMSEMIGRRAIYLSTFPFSMLFTMGVGLAQNARTVLVLRFFAGFVASPPMSIAGGTISDVWGNLPEEMSIAMALFCVGPFLGPVIGPIVGGFAAEYKGWRWTMWVSLMFSGAILPFLIMCPETFKAAILKSRAEKRGIKLIKQKIDFAYLKFAVSAFLLRPLEMLVVEPIVCLTSIYIAFVFAVLFGFFEAFPIIFKGVYRMDSAVSGLPFIGVGIGLILGVIAYIVLDKVKYFPKNPDGTRGKRDEEGKLIWDPPEKKLLVAEVGAIFLPISLFWLAWTSKASIHWIAPTLSGIPFGFGLIWVFFGVILYYSMSFPPAYVASALAANNLLRYIMASVFPLFTVQMYTKLHIDWATSLLAFIALAMVPIPFAFRKYGPTLRQKSKYGYAAFFKMLAMKKAAAEAAQAQPVVADSNDVASSKAELSNDSPYETISQHSEKDVSQQV